MTTRKDRGMRTQKVAADYFAANGFPHAESTGSGRSGVDILGMPGLAPEVKARRGFSPLEWLRQAATARAGVPFVVARLDGQGEATVDEWPVLIRLADFVPLLRAAGYGDPEPVEGSEGSEAA